MQDAGCVIDLKYASMLMKASALNVVNGNKVFLIKSDCNNKYCECAGGTWGGATARGCSA